MKKLLFLLPFCFIPFKSTACTTGQVLINGDCYNTIWNPFGGHLQYVTASSSGSASSLGVAQNGVIITSPTAQINFTGAGVTVTAVGSTATVNIPGGSGGSSSLAVTTGTSAGFTGLISSPTAVIVFDSNTTQGQLSGSSTYFFSLKSSSVTLGGVLVGGTNISIGAGVGMTTITFTGSIPAVNVASVTTGYGLSETVSASTVTIFLRPDVTGYLQNNQTSTVQSATGFISSMTVQGPSTVSDSSTGNYMKQFFPSSGPDTYTTYNAVTPNGGGHGFTMAVSTADASQTILGNGGPNMGGFSAIGGATPSLSININNGRTPYFYGQTIDFPNLSGPVHVTCTSGDPCFNWYASSFTFSGSTMAFVSTINVVGQMLANGSAGTNGQFWTSGGAGTTPSWTTAAASSGGSSLTVATGTVSGFTSNFSTAVTGLNLDSTQFSGTLTNTTFYFKANASTFTLAGTLVGSSNISVTYGAGQTTFSITGMIPGGNLGGGSTSYAQITTAQQSGTSTIFLASGTVNNLNGSTITATTAMIHPFSTSPVLSTGAIAVDTSSGELVYMDNAGVRRNLYWKRMTSVFISSISMVTTDATSTHTFFSPLYPVTLQDISCHFDGVGTTPATFNIYHGTSTTQVTYGTLTCSSSTTNVSPVAITANNSIAVGEAVQWRLTNTPTAADDYLLTLDYSLDSQ